MQFLMKDISDEKNAQLTDLLKNTHLDGSKMNIE